MTKPNKIIEYITKTYITNWNTKYLYNTRLIESFVSCKYVKLKITPMVTAKTIFFGYAINIRNIY